MKREYWIDNIKILACILVATGHFFQSMWQSGVLEKTVFLSWFDQTIYYFHVPLFFVCSGYLYQKYSTVRTFSAWKNSVMKKSLVLGIPYFTFSLATWGLKVLFSGSINGEVHSLWYDLFVVPQSPYWYLYTLFFVFAVTPTLTGKKSCCVAVLAAMLLRFLIPAPVYFISSVARNELWFVAGMALSVFNLPSVMSNRGKLPGVILLGIFLSLSVITCQYALEGGTMSLVMGILACCAIFLIVNGSTRKCWMAKYTMPVYLMHTIFAAGVRSVLFKLGIAEFGMHLALGLTASFAGPVLAAEIMARIKLDFFLFPGKYIRTR